MTEATYQTVSVEPDESVCTAVITAVASAKGVAPVELDQRLNDFVDPDALERLFSDTQTGTRCVVGHVCFEMAGCEVVVDASGAVSVTGQGDTAQRQRGGQAGRQGEPDNLLELDG